MGTKYKHISGSERRLLEKLREERIPVKSIAKILGYHQSTIYREIKRNHHIFWLLSWYGYRYYA